MFADILKFEMKLQGGAPLKCRTPPHQLLVYPTQTPLPSTGFGSKENTSGGSAVDADSMDTVEPLPPWKAETSSPDEVNMSR